MVLAVALLGVPTREVAPVGGAALVAVMLTRALHHTGRALRRDPLDFALARRQTTLRVVSGLAAVGFVVWGWVWFMPFDDSVVFVATPPIGENVTTTSHCNGLASASPGRVAFVAIADAGYDLVPSAVACEGARADRLRLLVMTEVVVALGIATAALLGRAPRARKPLSATEPEPHVP